MKYLFIILLLVGFSACSHKSEEQLLTEAKQAEVKKDFATAINLYSELVSAYPHGKHAEEVQYQIAVLYGNEVHDIQKSIDAYRTFYQNFPESNNAPSAMFLSGFLFNNELHNIDSARAIYQAFLLKYPKHQLAASAQFELQTLGQDPGAVLHNDILPKHAGQSAVGASAAK